MAAFDPRQEEASESAEALERLLDNVRAGSQDAFAQLVERLWAPLVRYAAGQLNELDGAQDVVQEVLVQLWQRRRAWTARGSARAYIFRIARNLIIDEQRKRQVRMRWLERKQIPPYAGPPTPSDDLDASLAHAAIERALAAMPPRRREVFVLVHMEGLSHAEAAQVMGISAQTVSNQMTAALRSLRDHLRDQVPDS